MLDDGGAGHLHVIDVYGISGMPRKGSDRESVARDLHDALAQLLRSLDGMRVIVMGDLNVVYMASDRRDRRGREP